MSSWRLLASGCVLLISAALGLQALAQPSVATLRQAQGGAPILAATPIVREFAVVTRTAGGARAISGNLVVWDDFRNYYQDIYGKDLATGREFAVVTNTDGQERPAISGNLVVWEDFRYGYNNPDIYGKDLASGREFAVVTHPAYQREPALSGNLVVWEDHRNGNLDIYGKNLSTGADFFVTNHPASQQASAISGNIVVWQDGRNGNEDIYGKDLASGREFAVVTRTAGQRNPAISGNLVVWQDWRNDPDGGCDNTTCNSDIYGKDLATELEFPVVTHTALQYYPAISGNLVVWQDHRNGWTNGDIYGKDLASGREFAVVTNPASQWDPAISGNLVVWLDTRNGNMDIYGARLEWPPAPGACSLTGTVRGQRGAYYLEEAGRVLAFLYGEAVNFPVYLGQRVTVGGPCRVWRESAGPRPVFLAQTILTVVNQAEPQSFARPKASRGATRGW